MSGPLTFEPLPVVSRWDTLNHGSFIPPQRRKGETLNEYMARIKDAENDFCARMLREQREGTQ